MSNSNPPRLIKTAETWIEGDATAQLERCARLPGIVRAVGMPDIYPGKGCPVGAVFFSLEQIYPYLIGNDIGCGMGIWRTDTKARKAKLDRWERRLRSHNLEDPWDGDTTAWLETRGIAACGYERALGTIGGGNHFAELLRVDEIHDSVTFSKLDLSKDEVLLLVHSGSRGFGDLILQEYVSRFRDDPLLPNSPDGRAYLAKHDHALNWAQANRALIATRVGRAIGAEPELVLDVPHNGITASRVSGESGFLHRKGAAAAEQGVIVIAGSRGTRTYLVKPLGDGEPNLQSLAHGAGRKWKRSDVKGRLKNRFSAKDLERTELGSRVLCDDRALLFEEAPQAYKHVDGVIEALVNAGVAKVVAVLSPMLTYKVTKS